MVKKHTTSSVALLQKKLSRRLKKSKRTFEKNYPHAVEFLAKKQIELGQIREQTKKLVASGIVAGTIMLASPAVNQLVVPTSLRYAELSQFERETLFSTDIIKYVVPGTYEITHEQEEHISELIKSYWNIDAYPVLDSKRLNHSFGRMGAEQHLPRFPGDTVFQHDELQKAGITPLRGAWGYFTDSKNTMTADLITKEKYYVAVQTLYLPEWNVEWAVLKEWYKFRKVIVINPHNGRTVVADIADAGPALWTGKHFGGSPEVMQYLDLYKGMMQGEVVLFFVDDKENKIPLGPVRYN
jgi:hypothetical protein